MKTEERHQLEQNDLADWGTRLAEVVRRYWILVIGAIIFAGVAVGSVSYWSASVSQNQADGWEEFAAVLRKPDVTPENRAAQLREVARRYEGTPVVPYAVFHAATLQFQDAKSVVLDDPSKAKSAFQDALKAYRTLADSATTPLGIRQQSAYAIGVIEETRDAMQEAKKAYQNVVDLFPETGFAEMARAGLKRVESPEAREFYAQLASYSPPKIDFDDKGNPVLPGLESPLGIDSNSIPLPPVVDPDASKSKGESKDGDAKPADSTQSDAKESEKKAEGDAAGKESAAQSKTAAAKPETKPAEPQPPETKPAGKTADESRKGSSGYFVGSRRTLTSLK